MKRSEIIIANQEAIAEYLVAHYKTVMECHGRIQYDLYIWSDGELEGMEKVSGDNSWLEPNQGENRELFFVTKVTGFNPLDLVDDDETEEADIITELVNDYRQNVYELIDSIIEDAKREENR